LQPPADTERSFSERPKRGAARRDLDRVERRPRRADHQAGRARWLASRNVVVERQLAARAGRRAVAAQRAAAEVDADGSSSIAVGQAATHAVQPVAQAAVGDHGLAAKPAGRPARVGDGLRALRARTAIDLKGHGQRSFPQ
jgi:hypothetical protein